MCGLAAVLLRRGAIVSGSDRSASPALTRLSAAGARICLEQAGESVPQGVTLVVASAAIPHDHPELSEARRRGVPVAKYAQFLGRVMAQHHGISIAGTHGKSTTTAWLTFVLRRAGLDPSFVVGAEVEQLGGGSGVGDGRYFVAESCEYDRSFLNLRPRAAAVLNIEEDHLDTYENIDEIREAFRQFVRLVPADGLVVLNAQDANCRGLADGAAADVETFALEGDATWRGEGLRLEDGGYSFDVVGRGSSLGRVRLGLPGRHNVMNALAVTALAQHCGVAWESLRESLATFAGARRRLEQRGEAGGVTICDDYAHHPTEIRATLRAARERYRPRRLCCIFQPHQHSRTRFLLEDFARSFELADRVVVPGIYFVRDSERERELVCSEDLIRRIREAGVDAEYIPDFEEIAARVAAGCEAGDLVLTMGAGDIWKVADDLVRRLRADRPL